MKMKKASVTILLFLTITETIFCQIKILPSERKMAPKVDTLFSKWNNNHSPGVSLAVIKDEKIVYEKSFGMANLEYSIPNKSNTVFNVASLSKQFTAFSIALLANKGKLSVNDDVHKYIPELPDYGTKITILNLLTHTSGLKDQWDLLYLAGWKQDDIIFNQDVLNLIFRQKELNFSPGERFQYCNSGYTLLALIVERITGKTFATWTKDNIFTPLGMSNSFFLDNYQLIIKNKAYSYKASEKGFEKSLINSTTTGANGLHTSLKDLCKWVDNYHTKIVGNDKVIKTIDAIPSLQKLPSIDSVNNKELKLNYGYGQGIKRYRGQTLIGHDGSDAGYRTYIGRFPNQNLSIILLGNFEAFEAEKTAMQIADIFLAEQLEPVTKEDAVAGKKLLIPESIEKAISGEYQIGHAKVLRIFVVDRNIVGEIKSEKRRFDLIPLSNTEYESRTDAINIKYIKCKNTEVDSISFSEKGNVNRAAKLLSVDLSHLKEYTGEFYCGHLSTTYSINFKDNQLVAILPRGNVVTITQIEYDNFFGSYWWIRDIKFLRNTSNEITGFEINNGRAKKNQFLKIR